MKRLLVHVEGQTEEMFVNEVLRPHLCTFGFESISARLLGNPRLRQNRGGIKGWDAVRQDLLRHLKADRSCCSTTMVDYYGLPSTGPGAWPGRTDASKLPAPDRARHVERMMLQDVQEQLGASPCNFLPFVLLHEFEALLFSDCQIFGASIGRSDLSPKFQLIRDSFPTPEDINDSPMTAPSKRVTGLYAGYEKPLFGNVAALDIGLPRIRAECPHFSSWLSKLEQLGTAHPGP